MALVIVVELPDGTEIAEVDRALRDALRGVGAKRVIAMVEDAADRVMAAADRELAHHPSEE